MLQILMSDNQLLSRAYLTPEPFSRPICSIVLAPTLEPIPGSAVATPEARDSPKPGPTLEQGTDIDDDGLSRSLEKVELEAGTCVTETEDINYFSPIAEQSAPSGSHTSGRRRPAIEIPQSTPDHPRFSSYPHPVATETSSPSIEPSGTPSSRLYMRQPLGRAKSRIRRAYAIQGESEDDGAVTSDDEHTRLNPRPRSISLSLASVKTSKPVKALHAPARIFGRRRAGSLGARRAAEYHEGDDEAWKEMATVESARLDLKPGNPFTYQQPVRSQSTLESHTSTITAISPPLISPRRSSLSSSDQPTRTMGHPEILESPEEMSIPHGPPPRRSSLDMTPLSAISQHQETFSQSISHDARSIISSSLVSSSLTCSDPSLFSPAASSQEHPLSSATTSLSRSAKSAKEGVDEHDAALSAVKLQRSLEWEAKQTKRRRRLDKRKMVLLELVETEVAYAEGLRALVQVYLPQLAALPAVSQRTAAMIARNSSDLLDFHADLATRMVEILKHEGIGYDIIHDPDVPVERASRKVAALFMEYVSRISDQTEAFG